MAKRLVRRKEQIARGSLALGVLALGSCAWVQLELSPYAPRSVTVVYSAQEDLTFYFWQIAADVDPTRVSFFLSVDGIYREIDLDEAPFPAVPSLCDDGAARCFQYQLAGRQELTDAEPLLRAVEADGDFYASGDATFAEEETTLSFEPVGIVTNQQIDANLVDWFDEQDQPLQRDFEWRFSEAEGEDCSERAVTDWEPLTEPLAVDHGWVEQELCFETRPVRQDEPGHSLRARLPPSAETFLAEQSYQPGHTTAPIQLAVLVDLRIPDPERCQSVQDTFLSTVRSALEERGELVEIGVFRPIGPGAVARDGCGQAADRRYPVTEIVDAVLLEVAQYEPGTVRPLLVYANNIELPLAGVLEEDLWAVGTALAQHTVFYTWAVSSAFTYVGDATMTWLAVDSEQFREEVSLFADQTLPFATLEHDADTPIPILQEDPSRAPTAVKICQAAPQRINGIQTAPGGAWVTPGDGAADWQERSDGYPAFTIDLGWQVLVESAALSAPEVTVHVEFCERFCDHPFRSAGDVIYASWRRPDADWPMEACVWF